MVCRSFSSPCLTISCLRLWWWRPLFVGTTPVGGRRAMSAGGLFHQSLTPAYEPLTNPIDTFSLKYVHYGKFSIIISAHTTTIVTKIFIICTSSSSNLIVQTVVTYFQNFIIIALKVFSIIKSLLAKAIITFCHNFTIFCAAWALSIITCSSYWASVCLPTGERCIRWFCKRSYVSIFRFERRWHPGRHSCGQVRSSSQGPSQLPQRRCFLLQNTRSERRLSRLVSLWSQVPFTQGHHSY